MKLGKCCASTYLKYSDCSRLIDHCWFFPENTRFFRSAQRTMGDRMGLESIHFSNFVPRLGGRYFSMSSWYPINVPVHCLKRRRSRTLLGALQGSSSFGTRLIVILKMFKVSLSVEQNSKNLKISCLWISCVSKDYFLELCACRPVGGRLLISRSHIFQCLLVSFSVIY